MQNITLIRSQSNNINFKYGLCMLETELEKSLQEKVEEHRVIFLMLYESLQMDLRSTSYDASKKIWLDSQISTIDGKYSATDGRLACAPPQLYVIAIINDRATIDGHLYNHQCWISMIIVVTTGYHQRHQWRNHHQ